MKARVISFLLLVVCARVMAADLPKIDIKDVFSARPGMIEDLAWLDRETLYASLPTVGGNGNAIFAWNVRTGARRPLVEGKYPAVSPDGKHMVYLAGSHWRLRRLSDGNEVEVGDAQRAGTQVFRAPHWSPDSQFVAITAGYSGKRAETDLAPHTSTCSCADASAQTGAARVNVVDLGARAEKMSTSYNTYQGIISVVEVANPQHAKVVNVDNPVYYSAWGAHHDLFYVEMNFSAPAYTRLERLDMSTMTPREIWRQDRGFMQTAEPAVSPDGRTVALTTDVDVGQWTQFVSLVLIDVGSGKVTRLTREQYATRPFWSPDGRWIYFTGRHGGLSRIYRSTLTGKIEELTTGPRRHYDAEVSPDGERLSYATEDGYGRRDVRVLQLSTRAEKAPAEKIVATIDAPETRYKLGRFEQVTFPTADGLSIYGYIFYPPDFDPSRTWPLYVDVHGGGPGSSLGLLGPLATISVDQMSPLEWHALAALGYVVFVPDMRSSGEYGAGVDKAMHTSGDFSNIEQDARDVDEATRWMLTRGFVDPQRVAVLGHSAGGGRVNYLLTVSHLYHAAILSDPIASGAIGEVLDLTTGSSAGGRFEDIASWSFDKSTDGVPFASNPAPYLKGFLFDGYKNTTPTLILVGNPEKGALGPISAEVLFAMLRQHNVPTRMLRYMDDGHNPTTPASAENRFGEVRAWLERYIPAR